MTAKDFRRIALGLQGTIEGEHMAHPDFRANGRILRETPFEKLYIQPAAGDAGGALGAALYAYNVLLGGKRNFVMQSAAWGEGHAADVVQKVLKENDIAYQYMNDEVALCGTVAAQQ